MIIYNTILHLIRVLECLTVTLRLSRLPGWCQRSDILSSIWYTFGAWCQHRSYELKVSFKLFYLTLQSRLTVWVWSLIALKRTSCYFSKKKTMAMRVIYSKSVGDIMHINSKWMINSYIHSTARWVFIYLWRNRVRVQIMARV